MNWEHNNTSEMAQRGWSILSGRVEQNLVQTALRAIYENRDKSLDVLPKYHYDTFCPDLCNPDQYSKPITDLLFESGISECVDAVMGEGLDWETSKKPQIAIRWTESPNATLHLDGFPNATSESPANIPDAILGIYLTDVQSIDDGALIVAPQSRPTIAGWAAAMTQAPRQCDRSALQSSFIDTHTETITGLSGTAFLCHGALPHKNANRISAGERVAVYFRLYLQADAALPRLRFLQMNTWGWQD